MKRSELPSQKKYRLSHPSISFRLKREDKERLDAIVGLTEISLSQWMANFLHNTIDPDDVNAELKALIEDAYDKLDKMSKELENAKKIERFTVPCTRCGKLLTLSSKNPNWETKISPKLKEAFAKWHHTKCRPK